ncbi:hypothetical protein EGI22_15760, partial [Lacihabitans sp. LS3-19]|nr:hypothetical protein [Lacihabitans sp. LS3-19]
MIAGGIYTVTVTDANGCNATAQTTVTVNAFPIISILDTICTQQGDFYSVEFNVTPGANVTSSIGTINGNLVENIPSGNEVTIYFELNNCVDSIKIIQLCPIPYGSIGDKVFSDINGDGIQDGTEPGLDGITVYLLDNTGNKIDSTITAGGGLYEFDS